MRTCQFCAEEIQDAAVVCKHCHREIAGAAAAPAIRKGMSLGMKALSVVGGLMAIGVLGNMLSPAPAAPTTSSSTTAPTDSPAPPPPVAPQDRLALLASRGYERSGYYIVEGQVTNLTDAPIRNVTAVSTWFTKDEQFITTDEALVDYNPLMPGQTSSFKTMSRENPQMSKFTVEFKQLMGGSIATRDDRKK